MNSAGAKIFTFGSYRLGVYGPGSDIDTLVVGPKNVPREAYFRLFPDLLVKHAPEGAITGLTSVPDAYVPVIKFEYSGISIDLLYSRIPALTSIPENLNLLNNSLLRGLEDDDIRVLNGNRVTDEIFGTCPPTGCIQSCSARHQALGPTTCHICKHCRLPWRCCLGNVGGTSFASCIRRRQAQPSF